MREVITKTKVQKAKKRKRARRGPVGREKALINQKDLVQEIASQLQTYQKSSRSRTTATEKTHEHKKASKNGSRII